jgi:fucose permease
LGAFQGAYGIGGIAGPLIATALVSRGFVWSRFYLIELGLAVFNLVFAAWAFWKYEQESDSGSEIVLAEDYDSSGRTNPMGVRSMVKRNWEGLKSMVSDRPTVLGSCFIFAYQGAEVAISGWIISFLV